MLCTLNPWASEHASPSFNFMLVSTAKVIKLPIRPRFCLPRVQKKPQTYNKTLTVKRLEAIIWQKRGSALKWQAPNNLGRSS